MKTYLKKYEVIDIKGYLDSDAEGKKLITYDDGEDTKQMYVDELLEMMLGSAIQFKTLVE